MEQVSVLAHVSCGENACVCTVMADSEMKTTGSCSGQPSGELMHTGTVLKRSVRGAQSLTCRRRALTHAN